ncbi:MAG TPA: LysM domain-containing protein [Candidatus Limnocylindrales bacterium]|nr:LysM domain-containing protein [Candidatus Limnocylindrales bacterium]
MTPPTGDAPRDGRRGDALEAPEVMARICPYLVAEGGGWRAARPIREHRCAAVRPPVPLQTEKQRRLCLTAAHLGCPTYEAALERRTAALARDGIPPERLLEGRVARAGLASTMPVALDRPSAVAGPAVVARSARRATQVGLVALMLLAAAALALARFGDAGDTRGGIGAASPSPAVSATASPPAATASPTPSPPATAVPTTAAPSPTQRTYTVKYGDTLSGIAARHGTTVEALKQLNNISDPRRIRPGQVLVLPPEGG